MTRQEHWGVQSHRWGFRWLQYTYGVDLQYVGDPRGHCHAHSQAAKDDAEAGVVVPLHLGQEVGPAACGLPQPLQLPA